MPRYITYLFLMLLSLPAAGQINKSLEQAVKAAAARDTLIMAFRISDRETCRQYLDTLRRLEDNDYLPLQWDEKWLLYLWLEEYQAALNEAARFTKGWEEWNMMKMPPPKDSLFEVVDNQMYLDRDLYFERIRLSNLSAEDREFAGLLLHFLLRLSPEEPATSEYDARLNAFLQRYPQSRYAHFIRKRMYNTPPPGNWALSFDMLLFQGNWTGALEQNFRTSYGGDFGLAWWGKRWNVYFRVPIGFQKLNRPVVVKGYEWAKDESSNFFALELETGYDLINQPRLRILPTIGGGYSTLRPPGGDEDDPNPDYFDFFKFRGAHLTAALQADVKFKSTSMNVASSYHGIRVRLGYRWLNLGPENPAIRGNMFFFAVGYTIFGRQSVI